ncbi:MAG TPA: formate dehydrogenase subunit gamma [Acidimicrobiia bacterium]
MIPWSDERARTLAEQLAGERGALLPVLHALQDTFGYVDPRAVAVVADVLNLSRAEVHGVVTFYRDFRREPPGRHVVKVCRAEACQAVGADGLVAGARAVFGVDVGGTSADGRVSLDEVFCLGNCALGPSVMVDGRVHGHVDADRLEELLELDEPAPARAPGGVTVYVPGDASARAVGADEVAAAIAEQARARGTPANVVRNGSRGLLWLEPLVEVATAGGRVAYGPVGVDDVASLLDADFLSGGDHALAHGPTDAIPWLARQERITFARVGVVDPLSPEEYEAHGGLAGLRRALTMSPESICDELVESGLRGRGGAGFPAGIKWRAVLDAPAGERFVCCNADEGDSGTFADRMLMEGDPFLLIEGMLVAAHVIGAREGFVYLRSEYPDALRVLRAAVDRARDLGWLGDAVLGTDMAFDITIRVGAGSYVCGEETAMLESLEGKRGVVRAKPPLPAIEGLFGKPTIVNNVLTLASVPPILAGGAAAFAGLGVGRSRGTQVFQLAGNVAQGGIVEVPFGITLRELVEDFGSGSRTGRPVRAAQVGGPLGAYLPATAFDVVMDYEALVEAGGLLGHGGVVVFDDTVDLARQARFAMEFCAQESCGKCTPCRIGAARGVEILDRVLDGSDVDANLALLDELCEVMTDGSLCAMGGLTPLPVRSALRHFGDDFASRGGTVAGARREGAGA